MNRLLGWTVNRWRHHRRVVLDRRVQRRWNAVEKFPKDGCTELRARCAADLKAACKRRDEYNSRCNGGKGITEDWFLEEVLLDFTFCGNE